MQALSAINEVSETMERKTIVVLANSVKKHQHCVAGKCLQTGRWVRPVSTPQGGELTDAQVRYTNSYGTYYVKNLQKIEMEFSLHVPLLNQPDNYLISGNCWQQRYKIDTNDLVHYLDTPYSLWGSGDNLIYQFIESGEIEIYQSLFLVKVDNLRLYRNCSNKRRASFIYNNIHYDLAVTDPNFDNLLQWNQETHSILCISLAEVWQGRCYKIVASIF